MTIAEPQTRPTYTQVVNDLYCDIHKGIRAELFDVTLTAGRIDPSDRAARVELAAHVGEVAELIFRHAEHEDAAILPVLETHLPLLGEKIATDHHVVDGRLATLRDFVDETVDVAPAAARFEMQHVYIELASFTSAFLEHQDVEERVVMPALEKAVGPDEVLVIHGQIIGSIPPDEMARGLAVMLPAMNIDDRAMLLGGTRANAPAEVFAGVWGLASSVLTEPDLKALGSRLGL